MHRLRFLWFRFMCRNRPEAKSPAGQTLVEYTLILAVISILALSVFSAMGNRVVVIFSTITSLLDTAQKP